LDRIHFRIDARPEYKESENKFKVDLNKVSIFVGLIHDQHVGLFYLDFNLEFFLQQAILLLS
jgi:hypothetical protein